MFNVIEINGNNVFEDDLPYIALKARVVSYALARLSYSHFNPYALALNGTIRTSENYHFESHS